MGKIKAGNKCTTKDNLQTWTKSKLLNWLKDHGRKANSNFIKDRLVSMVYCYMQQDKGTIQQNQPEAENITPKAKRNKKRLAQQDLSTAENQELQPPVKKPRRQPQDSSATIDKDQYKRQGMWSHKECLQTNSVFWVDNLDTDGPLIDHMFQEKILTVVDKERLENHHWINADRVRHIITLLWRKPLSYFRKFLKILEATDQNYLIPEEAKHFLKQDISEKEEVSIYEPHMSTDDPVDLFKQPYCLISHEMKVQKPVLDALKRLPRDKSLVVIAIAGPLRSGKSYLINRLAGETKGSKTFKTYYGTDGVTKGIWIRLQRHPYSDNKYLLLLDTEGLGDPRSLGEEEDSGIFSLATLLCSLLVFNVQSHIGLDSIQTISQVTQLSKCISTGRGRNDYDFDMYFPRFVFVIRDFDLTPEADGKITTPDGYLEDKLKYLPGDSQRVKTYNEIRRCIRQYFRSRKCFLMERPAGSRFEIQQLGELSDDQLFPKFVADYQEFEEYILGEAPEKTLHTGQRYNGRMWAETVLTYVSAIHEEILPNTQVTPLIIGDTENEQLLEEGIQLYTNAMDKVKLPLPAAKLSDHHWNNYNRALKHFTEHMVHSSANRFLTEINRIISEKFKQYMDMNTNSSREKCTKILQLLSKPIDKKVKEKKYAVVGGYEIYKKNMKTLQDKYFGRNDLGLQMDMCYLDFLDRRKMENDIIMSKDRAISQKLREDTIASLNKKLERKIQQEKEKLKKLRNAEFEKEHMKATALSIDQWKKDRKDVLKYVINNLEEVREHRLKTIEELKKENCETDAMQDMEYIERIDNDIRNYQEELSKEVEKQKQKKKRKCTIS